MSDINRLHRVVYVTYIQSSPEQVWQALTDPDRTERYFHSTRIDSAFEKGAPVSYRMPDGTVAVEGEVLEVELHRRLAITWHVLYDEECRLERPSRVTFEIEPLGDVCRLTMTHDDFDGETATYRNVSQGWGAILCSLKTLIETGEPMAQPAVD